MKTVPIPASLFQLNRERLRALLPPNSLVIVQANDILPTNADGTLPLWQNADLFYLTGVNQEETIFVMAPDAFDPKHRELLFVRETSELLTIWEGHKLSKVEASKRSGIAEVRWTTDFESILRNLMCDAEHVYLNTNEHARAADVVQTRERRFIQSCMAQYPLHDYRRLARLTGELRLVKSAAEIELLKKACAITRDGFARVCRMVQPGVNEADVEAEFAHEFIRQKGVFAYNPIIASGVNNCILHYNENDQTCRKGELLLLDVAAGYGQYNADLTRTIPVSGKFSRRQKAVYQAVLRVFRKIVDAMRPGVTTRDLRLLTEKLIGEECVELGLIKASELKNADPDHSPVKPYFMHGVAHPLGLDVHDVGLPRATLAPGWVLTCEPGIYIRDEGFGIRLENDILVTDGEPIDLMADIPIESDEIEALMRSARG